MDQADVQYAVELKVEEPKLAAERRFIEAERRYVQQQLMKSAGESWKTWRPVKVGALGIFRRQDWEKYEHELAKYGHALDRYERDIADGLIPFKIYVSNLGKRNDAQIAVKVAVENGTIHEARKAPERPERLDATAPVPSPSRPGWAPFRGFIRRKIKIGQHELGAEFSQLGAGESAELVRQVLHLAVNDDTRLHYELQSRLAGEMHGEVAVLAD